MKNLLFYLLQVVVASGLLYGYYHFFLRNKKFHRYNRFYLLTATVLSISIPFINIPVYFTHTAGSSFVLHTLTIISSAELYETTVPAITAPIQTGWLNWKETGLLLYLLATLVFFIKMIISIRRIQLLAKHNPSQSIGNIRFVTTDLPEAPFSFFRNLFWNKNIELRSEKGEQVFRHELFHIEQKHSWDIIYLELLTILFWVNPFFHLVKKETKAIHEFLADQHAIDDNNKWEYAELLLMQALQTRQSLIHPFFHTQIKRRIAMITNPVKTSHQYLNKLMVLPVAAMIATLFAFNYRTQKDVAPLLNTAQNLTVVIDASHGGSDAGASSPDHDYTEADISLQIARKIKELAPAYHVNVIMTRESASFPGNAGNKETALRKRVEITNAAAADAFISIHLNTTADKAFQQRFSGIDAYVSARRNDPKGRGLASIMIRELGSVYKASPGLRSNSKPGVFVLDSNKCPAVLLECGYINNPEDLQFIIQPANQEKIARGILQSIADFRSR